MTTTGKGIPDELLELECTKDNFNQLLFEVLRLQKELSYTQERKKKLQKYEEENLKLRKKVVEAITEANRVKEELIRHGIERLDTKPVLRISAS